MSGQHRVSSHTDTGPADRSFVPLSLASRPSRQLVLAAVVATVSLVLLVVMPLRFAEAALEDEASGLLHGLCCHEGSLRLTGIHQSS